MPCRSRKVKCNLGSVDNPGEPPCLRCKREKKDCVFTEQRRKRKTDSEPELTPDAHSQFPPAKRLNGLSASGVPPVYPGQLGNPYSITPSLPSISALQRNADPNIRIESPQAGVLFENPIRGHTDAMTMLADASRMTEEFNSSQARALTGPSSDLYRAQFSGSLAANGSSLAIDPELENHDPEVVAAVEAWASNRFVRAGYFTVLEGIQYIQYFFERMAPLTPIQVPNYSDLKTHPQFLRDEPMLSVTLLTIASRYMKLSGPGQESRRFKVHDQLWQFLQKMIMRMFFGQDQFGFYRGGSGDQTQEEAEASKRGLRSLGTAER